MSENLSSTTPAPKRSRRAYLLGGAGALLLTLCGCLVLLAGVIYVDPFDLYLLDRLNGRYDAALVAVPATSSAYASFNLVNARGENLDQVIAAFAQTVEEAEVQNSDDLINQLDDTLRDEIGLTLSDDVLPWIGQYVGFSLGQLRLNESGQPEQLEWLVTAESRDNEAADRFLLAVRDRATADGERFTEETIEGVTVYALVTDEPLEQVAFGRSGNLVLIASGTDQLRAGLDAQHEGLSLAESQVYRDLAAKLPRDRILTFYLSGQQLQSLTAAFEQSVPGIQPDNFAAANFGEMVLGLSAVESGIRLDSVMRYNPETLTEAQRLSLEAADQEHASASLLPANSLVYVSGFRLDQLWTGIRAGMIANTSQQAFDESMESFAFTYGINPDEALFPLLDGEWAVAVMPGADSILAERTELGLGVMALAETSQEAVLLSTLDTLSTFLQEQAVIVERTESAGTTLYTVDAGLSDRPQLAFGVGAERYFFITTDTDDGAALFADGAEGLADSGRYEELWAAFPAETRPTLFVDMQGLFGTIREGMSESARENFNEAVRSLEPITFVAGGNQPAEGDIHQGALIIFVNTPAAE